MSRTSAWSRRDVLRNGLAAASGIFTPRSMLGLLGSGAAGAALSAGADYKALVCIYLYGGNDGFNTLLPYDDARFKRYSKIRGSLALPRETLLPLSAAAADVETYAVHPSMPEVAELYGAGRLAFITNVGPLLAPTSKADVLAGRNLPPRLNSHSDQQDCWMSSVPDAALRLGWGGRLADLLGSVNANPRLSMNISVSGNNLFQVGQTSIPYTLATTGVPHFDALSTSDLGLRRTQVYRQLLVQAEAAHRFERADSRLLSRAIDLGMEVDTALQAAPALQTVFPDGNRLSDQLKMVARMISARDSLQLTRQVFFVTMGGFDTHDEQLPTQAFLLAQLSQAMQAFYMATVELGVQDAVTTFTASEFSRTLTSNGDGSDHAWGSVHCAFGGAVKGGNVYGRFPDQTLNGPDDSGGGHMIPTTSVEQYGATMLRWFGADEDQIDTVFPHLSRFATRGLGFV